MARESPKLRKVLSQCEVLPNSSKGACMSVQRTRERSQAGTVGCTGDQRDQTSLNNNQVTLYEEQGNGQTRSLKQSQGHHLNFQALIKSVLGKRMSGNCNFHGARTSGRARKKRHPRCGHTLLSNLQTSLYLSKPKQVGSRVIHDDWVLG